MSVHTASRWIRRRVVGLMVVLAVVATGAAGCALLPFGRPSGQAGEQPVPPQPDPGQVVVRLYFADSQAMYLLPEDRTVTAAEGETYESLAVRELIAGPRLEGHGRTIPEETKLLSIELREGVAYVNFSKEIQTNHWGGSTGEMFTLMSIVNSLTEKPDITAVQLLIEGTRVESLAGHVDTTVPLERNEDLIAGG